MLDISDKISNLRKLPFFGNYLAIALENIVDGVNNLGKNLAADPTKTLPPPNPIQQLTVKTNGMGLVHAVITDNGHIKKGVHYFVEYDNNPNFTQPHVVHLGVSRSMSPLTLPGSDDNGNPQSFYFRAYSQYPGSHPGPIVKFGGIVPTPVSPGGMQQLTLLQSTGSGTAQSNGEQGGSGFGKVLVRPQSTLKGANQQ